MTSVAPAPSPTVPVHPVRTRFARDGWTLRFGSAQAVVPTLADAPAAGRRLVAGALGLAENDVRVSLVGEPAVIARRAPWWRGRPPRM